MSRLGTALRLFWRTLRFADFAERGRQLLDEPVLGIGAPGTLSSNRPGSGEASKASATSRGANAAVQRPRGQNDSGLGPTASPSATPLPSVRSDALTLLGVLQREARLIDFLKEDITPFNDAQVGAAVRDVHRDASAALSRMFDLKPVMTEPEGSVVQIASAGSGKARLTGNVTGTPPYRGALRHGGWQATKVQLPQWNGAPDTATIIAPAEVELS